MTNPPSPLPTEALELAQEYVRLGGKRRSANDDNLVSTREWEADSAEAKSFWQSRIEPLSKDKRAEVITHLPSVSVV
ncbi:hypothetical protein QTL95_06235 [Rhizobium sp. S152]|uniref:hypothetical protein n=1 Tax=Rhizobium sp. S152 TaxID=3055038 RepID=UPI0025A9DA06|nr:hypothetical protein [Rhizobium sp. S152]MDM9625484.1 hypothetical protein [Rhizobium sp. S152]